MTQRPQMARMAQTASMARVAEGTPVKPLRAAQMTRVDGKTTAFPGLCPETLQYN